MPDNAIATLRRKLAAWELKHLRKHAAELAEQIESLQKQLNEAREDAEWLRRSADQWWEASMALQEELTCSGAQVGLTKTGSIVVINQQDQEAA